MIFLLVIIFVLIALADFPKLIQDKKWYECTVLLVFFISAFMLAMLQLLGIPIPSPIKGVEFIISNVLHFSYS